MTWDAAASCCFEDKKGAVRMQLDLHARGFLAV
jgi:hypothetical protein